MRGRARQFIRDWPAHILTVLLISGVLFLAPQQAMLLLYKATLPMIGACGGYWLARWFIHYQSFEATAEKRWQLVALMCAGMLSLGLAA